MTLSSAAFFLAFSLGQSAVTTKPFVTADRLLEMQIPSAWTVKKEKTRQLISIITPSGPARVEVYSVRYLQPAADWQAMQATVTEQMKRTMVRQWEEEILSVPMLMTRIKYSEPREGEMGALTGLLYAKSAEKFQFRLVAPLSEFDALEDQWRESLLTLRTASGTLPAVEDGTSAATPTPGQQRIGATLNMSSMSQPLRPLGPTRVEFQASGRGGVLRLPKGVTSPESGKLQISGLSEPVAVEFFSNLDSPASGLFVMQEVNKDLARFKTVVKRENVGPRRNDVGTQAFGAFRTGTSESGDLQTFIGVVDSGSFYGVFRFEATDTKQFERNQRALQSFLMNAGFEPSK